MTTFSLSTLHEGQIANLSGSFSEILKAMLFWRNSSFKNQEDYIKESFSASVATADAAFNSLNDQANEMVTSAAGQIAGGTMTCGFSMYGMGQSLKAGGDLDTLQTNMKTDDFGAIGAENPENIEEGDAQYARQRERILDRQFFDSGEYQNMSPADIRNARESCIPAQREEFDERLEKAKQTQKEAGIRTSNYYSALGQGTSQVTQGSVNAAASTFKRAQAEQEKLKAIAQFLTQVAQVVNSMLTTLTQQASSALENVFNTEGTVSNASLYRG